MDGIGKQKRRRKKSKRLEVGAEEGKSKWEWEGASGQDGTAWLGRTQKREERERSNSQARRGKECRLPRRGKKAGEVWLEYEVFTLPHDFLLKEINTVSRTGKAEAA